MSSNIFDDPRQRPTALPSGPPQSRIVKGLPDPIDFPAMLASAKAKFEPYKKEVEKLKAEVMAFKVVNDQDVQDLTALAATAAKLAKTLEDKRKEFIKDPDTFVRGLNSFVKVFREILTNPKPKTGLVEVAKKKIGEYQYKVELERRKAEKAAQEEQAKLQAQIDKEAAAAGVAAPQLPPQVIPDKTAPIRTEAGSANFSTEWVFELKDINLVPNGYLVVDEQKVKAAIKAGVRSIPGLEIKEAPVIKLRTA